ncbi:hypothetical protein J3R83DRAFT_8926 [Lanmaoa asiatica]|nr:hypothetical protein J3R83DRAFT_8926 [Lanmaoa asiatica]
MSHYKIYCVVHPVDHNNLPNFIGPYFSKRDDESPAEVYLASMMLLFKPWHDLQVDLKQAGESWKEAFERWYPTTSSATRRMMNNIQYYYECQRSDSQPEAEEVEPTATEVDSMQDVSNKETDGEVETAVEVSPPLSREEVHGKIAIWIAEELGFFPSQDSVLRPVSVFLNVRSVRMWKY